MIIRSHLKWPFWSAHTFPRKVRAEAEFCHNFPLSKARNSEESDTFALNVCVEIRQKVQFFKETII